MAYQNKPVVKPADLARQQNGKLDLGLLTSLPMGALHHRAADAWLAMCAAALTEADIVLAPSSRGDTYRTYDMQLAGFKMHYTTDVVSEANTKVWEGKKWYQRPTFYPAAIPGESNHGWGLAIDIANFGLREPLPRKERWVIDNYERFGFSHEYSFEKRLTDPPHIHYYRGDDVPDDVRAATGENAPASSGRGLTSQALPTQQTSRTWQTSRALSSGRAPVRLPQFDPEFGQFSLWPLATKKPRLQVGATGDAVRYAQGVLHAKLGYANLVDGEFDDVFRNFVVWFQSENGIGHDGRIGKQTWQLIDAIALG